MENNTYTDWAAAFGAALDEADASAHMVNMEGTMHPALTEALRAASRTPLVSDPVRPFITMWPTQVNEALWGLGHHTIPDGAPAGAQHMMLADPPINWFLMQTR